MSFNQYNSPKVEDGDYEDDEENNDIKELRKYNPDEPINEQDQQLELNATPKQVKSPQQNSPKLSEQQQPEGLNQTASFQKDKQKKNNAIKPYPLKQEPINPMRLAEINQKLKEELAVLIEKLETALEKFKEKKAREKDRQLSGMGHYGLSYQKTGDILQKEKEINSAQVRALQVKKEIARVKRQLETQFDMNTIVELENEIKSKEMIISKLEDQNQQMLKVGGNQQKAMEDLNKQEDIQKKLGALNTQIRQTKFDIRDVGEKYKEIDKVLQVQHSQVYDLEERYRKINILIKNRNKILRQKSESQTTGNEDGDDDEHMTEEQLVEAIAKLQVQKEEEEKSLKKQIFEQEKINRQLMEMRNDEEKVLRGKEIEVKKMDFQIREIKRQQQAANQIARQQEKERQQKEMRESQFQEQQQSKRASNPESRRSTANPNKDLKE